MSRIFAKAIPAAQPEGAKLLVTRNEDRRRLTLSISLEVGDRNNVLASVSLDPAGWDDLCQCIAFAPPAGAGDCTVCGGNPPVATIASKPLRLTLAGGRVRPGAKGGRK